MVEDNHIYETAFGVITVLSGMIFTYFKFRSGLLKGLDERYQTLSKWQKEKDKIFPAIRESKDEAISVAKTSIDKMETRFCSRIAEKYATRIDTQMEETKLAERLKALKEDFEEHKEHLK